MTSARVYRKTFSELFHLCRYLFTTSGESGPRMHAENARWSPKVGETRETVREIKRSQAAAARPDIVTSASGNRYFPLQLIGRGGFGQVYMCSTESKAGGDLSNLVALKVELEKGIKSEQEVLTVLSGQHHFCQLIDQGPLHDEYYYLVMTLLGPNLSHTRKSMPGKRFSISTALRCALQMLMAIETLHYFGFISRDVKPSNFAIGRPTERRRMIYMIDFGIAVRFRDGRGKLIKSNNAHWRGTTRYCSLGSHRRQGPTMKDDLESWFYSLMELGFGELPWYHCTKQEKPEVYRLKRMCRDSGRANFLGSAPFEFDQMLSLIDRYGPKDAIDYTKFYGAITKVLIRENIRFNAPYDWEFLVEDYVNTA